MSKEFINFNKTEKDWKNFEFRKEANEKWSKIKNKLGFICLVLGFIY